MILCPFAGGSLRNQLQGQRLGNACGDIGLHLEAIGEVPLVGFGPEMRLAGGLDQARGDPYAIALAADAALEQVVRAQRLPDLARALRAVLEDHR